MSNSTNSIKSNNIIPHCEKSSEPFTTRPEKLIEGLTNTAYCQPIEVIDSSGAEDANLTIPLTGLYTPNDATNNIIRTAINFMSFVLVLGFTYMITPIIYNEYIIGLVELTGLGRMTRIRCIDIYINVIFIMATLSLITSGVSSNNPNLTIMGFFLGLFFIFSYFIIQKEKLSETWFNKQFPKDVTLKDYASLNVSTDFLRFITSNFFIFFFKIQNLLIGGIILFIISSFGYMTGAFGEKGVLNSGAAVIYIMLLTIYLTIAIDTVALSNK